MTTSASDALVDALMTKHGDASKYEEGTIFETEPCVCRSNAGFYIGSWCIEAIGTQWLPQPYSRDTIYFNTAEQAAARL